MADWSPGASIARRRLGRALRDLREQANIRTEAAARELECSSAKISRLENGQGPAKLWDVRILLSLYGVVDRDVCRQYEDWARETKSVSWWESDADLTSDDVDRFLAAETTASHIRTYCTLFLPAMLRFGPYSAAYIRALYPSLLDEDIARWELVQEARQSRLISSTDAPTIEVIVDEAALLRRVGTAEVHSAQLERLLRLLEDPQSRRPTRGLLFRVYPLSAGPTRALSPFTIFSSDRPDMDPPSVFMEDAADSGSWWESVDEFVALFDELRVRAATPEESLEILREAIVFSRRAGSSRVASLLIKEGEK